MSAPPAAPATAAGSNSGFLRPALGLAGAVVAAIAAMLAVTWADLDSTERSAVSALMTPQRIGVVVLLALFLGIGLLAYVRRRHLAVEAPAMRLAESIRLATTQPSHRGSDDGAPALREVARAFAAFADQHERVLAEMSARVASARADLEAERNRLAALMSELRSSVLVCNGDGQVLLYNASARRLLGGADGVHVGLGRSVFGVIDRGLIVHALDAVARQTAKGSTEPTAQFVAARGEGGLIRVTLAPVQRDPAQGETADGGFVLVCADVTETVEQGSRRDALMQTVTESTRGTLANIRAAVENLVDYPDMPADRRTRFTMIVRDESVRLSERLEATTREFSEVVKSQWPLEEMRGEDLVTVARARIEARTQLGTKLEEIDPQVWIRVDSFSVAQGLTYVASRLESEFAIREVRFRLAAAGRHAHLDILWRGAPLSPETAFAWENDPFQLGGEASPLSLKAVVERHHGELWYTRDRPSQSAYFRLVLPLAAVQPGERAAAPVASRPEYYDFDLFRRGSGAHALDDRALADLTCTVFDTETTGLDPAAGDEIISIAAARIVNGRLLHGETFESLVDPKRPLAPESMAIHGITPEMLEGQPAIEEVLPRFHRFAADTVLLAHNAAFDMRFLSLKQAATGIVFDQPVLDTLLLSAVAHPNQESHSLEAIAGRLGVAVVGRHTALGDALVTGEVFLRLVPVLAERGIRTLREAREASAETFYARVKY